MHEDIMMNFKILGKNNAPILKANNRRKTGRVDEGVKKRRGRKRGNSGD